MKKNFIIFGGTKGIGKELANCISKSSYNTYVVGRSKNIIKESSINYLHYDLEKLTTNDFYSIFKKIKNINGICFTQRYRSKNENDNQFINEANLMVGTVAICMEALIKFNYEKTITEKNFTRVILMGSSYASKVGYDQNWSYHACKAAQKSLVSYFAVRSKGSYSINLLSPATYIKKGTEDYWETQEKYQYWKKYTSKGLATAKEISKAVFNFMNDSSPLISGNEIFMDGGLFNLYPDQDPQNMNKS